jgi:hypothetical protein
MALVSAKRMRRMRKLTTVVWMSELAPMFTENTDGAYGGDRMLLAVAAESSLLEVSE